MPFVFSVEKRLLLLTDRYLALLVLRPPTDADAGVGDAFGDVWRAPLAALRSDEKHLCVRGDDLLHATPSQVHLARLLAVPEPTHAHVALVVGPDGLRLAKRHGAVTMADLARRGVDAAGVRSLLAASLGLAEPGEPVRADELVDRCHARGDAVIPRVPWVFDPAS